MTPSLLITQHLVRRGDFFEAVIGSCILVEVGMVLPCQLFIGLTDGGLVGIALDAQNRVQIAQCSTRLGGLPYILFATIRFAQTGLDCVCCLLT